MMNDDKQIEPRITHRAGDNPLQDKNSSGTRPQYIVFDLEIRLEISMSCCDNYFTLLRRTTT